MSLDASGTRAANAAMDSMNTDLGLNLSGADLATAKANLRPLIKEILLELINDGDISTTVPGTGLVGNLGNPITGAGSGSGGIS